MSQVKVSPQLLHWARERAGLPKEELEERFPKYSEWERGEAMPTLRQLEDLAKKTRTPLGYFFLPEPPEEKLPVSDFRTKTDEHVRRPTPDLLETVRTMQMRQDWLSEYLREQEAEPLEFFGSVSRSDSPVEVAGRIRETLELEGGWARRHRRWQEALSELREAVERIGILIVINGVVGNDTHRKLDPEEFRGFVLPDHYAPLIFVNGADAKSAQMFTIAHELAHVWLGEGGVFDLPGLRADQKVETERWCNAVAAEFLVPARELLDAWSGLETSQTPFHQLARHFKVSPLVAARRTLDLGLIEKERFFGFLNELREQERQEASKGEGGGDFFASQNLRLGKRFGRLIIQAAREGQLLYRDAYRLTGLQGKTFDEFAKRLGLAR